MTFETRCGYVAIVGRPNVGKSTLLNRLIGSRVSITSKKPQTTRYQILGINTHEKTQVIYIDTPGVHKNSKHLVNRQMNRAALGAIQDVDAIVFVIEAQRWTEEDEHLLEKLKFVSKPIILALNKIDLLKDKKQLLPIIANLSQKRQFVQIIPLSVLKDMNVDALEQEIKNLLPHGPFMFSEEQITDRSDTFIVSEVIREKIMRVTGDEVPYDAAVVINEMKWQDPVLHIHAVVWVSRRGQKTILVGARGEKMKQIGTMARLDLEKIFDCKVFLDLWVKVKEGWSDDERLLTELGMSNTSE